MSNQPLRILHFADAHIDIANYGRHDPVTGLPVRVGDFLSALDQIVDAAIEQQVDLVIFAGDAYKDRNPQPTFQRAWGQRIMRLSEAGIPTLMLVGNHDVAPAVGRAHTIEEFKTFHIPHVHIADRLALYTPEMLGVPVQVITVPWITRAAVMTREESAGKSLNEVLMLIEERVDEAIAALLDQTTADTPVILAAHASVKGARYGSERAVMLGHELLLGGRAINDRRVDYVALGHIHKHQCLNVGAHPPAVYPGSIERIDFGEVREDKGFVMAEVTRGRTEWRFIRLKTRPFLDISIETRAAESFMADILSQLPSADEVAGAVCRVQLTYPRDWETRLDEGPIRARFAEALSFQLRKHWLEANRSRVGDGTPVESMPPEELLELYWRTMDIGDEEIAALHRLARTVLASAEESAI
jgi:exonuclease SbcD